MTRSPRIKRIDAFMRGIAYWLVVGLALLVPMFDRQPVNGMAALLAIVALVRIVIAGREGVGRWSAIDWTLLMMLVFEVLSTLFGWPSVSGRWQGVSEAISYCSLFLALHHGKYSKTQLVRIAMAVVAGAVAASAMAIAQHLNSGAQVQLPAVSGTIRSSLYIGIVLMLVVGLMFSVSGAKRYAGLVVAIYLSVVLFSMTSRGVLIATICCLLIGLSARLGTRMLSYAMLLGVLSALVIALIPNTLQKQLQGKTTELVELVTQGKVSENDQVRIEIWRVAWAWIGRGEHILVGIGPRNYHLIDADQLDLQPPLRFEESRHISHAHNLFITRYIEQGLIGLLALLTLFVLTGNKLWRDGRAGRADWPWWGALGGLLLPVLSGLFNSPWNHEYAWLAVLNFALYFASVRLVPVRPDTDFRQ